MGKLKKLQRRAKELTLRIRIVEQERYLAELREGQCPKHPLGFVTQVSDLVIASGFEGDMSMGGKPSKGTPADKRLKGNKGTPVKKG